MTTARRRTPGDPNAPTARHEAHTSHTSTCAGEDVLAVGPTAGKSTSAWATHTWACMPLTLWFGAWGGVECLTDGFAARRYARLASF